MEIYVTRIKEETAIYLVHKDKEHSGGYVYAYEKVEEVTELT